MSAVRPVAYYVMWRRPLGLPPLNPRPDADLRLKRASRFKTRVPHPTVCGFLPTFGYFFVHDGTLGVGHAAESALVVGGSRGAIEERSRRLHSPPGQSRGSGRAARQAARCRSHARRVERRARVGAALLKPTATRYPAARDAERVCQRLRINQVYFWYNVGAIIMSLKLKERKNKPVYVGCFFLFLAQNMAEGTEFTISKGRRQERRQDS